MEAVSIAAITAIVALIALFVFSKLLSSQKRVQELVAENATVSAELKNIQVQLRDAIDQSKAVEDLKIGKAELEQKLKNESESLSDTVQAKKHTDDQIEELRSKVENLTSQNAALNSNAENQSESIKETKAANEKLETQVAQLREQVTELSNAKSTLQVSLKEAHERLGERDELVQQTKAANEKLEAELKQLREQVTELSNAKSTLQVSLKETQERLGERDELEKRFSDTFKSLSTQTLEQQQKTFMENAGASLKEREQAVEKLVKPLSERIEALDKARVGSESAIKQQIEYLVQSNKEVANETRSLSTALSKPQARGRWGEMQVERALELSGLTKGIHYSVQASDGDGGRTDFIVHMPHNRDIILDSKVSLVAYLDAQNAKTEEGRNNHLERHARQMQSHASDLAKKEYWSNLPDAVDFVVMVVPEFALPPAVERRPDLIDQALQNSVVISTHSTLVALLKTVAMGWQERTVADEALRIGALGKELHDRLRVYTEHVAKVGNALDNAVLAYNASVGSFESRVLVQARRFPELGLSNTKELAALEPVDTSIRSMRPNTLAESNVYVGALSSGNGEVDDVDTEVTHQPVADD